MLRQWAEKSPRFLTECLAISASPSQMVYPNLWTDKLLKLHTFPSKSAPKTDPLVIAHRRRQAIYKCERRDVLRGARSDWGHGRSISSSSDDNGTRRLVSVFTCYHLHPILASVLLEDGFCVTFNICWQNITMVMSVSVYVHVVIHGSVCQSDIKYSCMPSYMASCCIELSAWLTWCLNAPTWEHGRACGLIWCLNGLIW